MYREFGRAPQTGCLVLWQIYPNSIPLSLASSKIWFLASNSSSQSTLFRIKPPSFAVSSAHRASSARPSPARSLLGPSGHTRLKQPPLDAVEVRSPEDGHHLLAWLCLLAGVPDGLGKDAVAALQQSNEEQPREDHELQHIQHSKDTSDGVLSRLVRQRIDSCCLCPGR